MISKNTQDSKDRIKELFNNSTDLVYHEFQTLADNKALIVYINGLIDKGALDEYVIKPLIKDLMSPWEIKSTLFVTEIKEIFSMKDVVKEITDGHVVLFHEDMESAFILNLCSYEKRAIEISENEQVVRGPKESFIEDIFVNKSLIRRKIRNRNLVFEDYIFGEITNTQVSIVYINGIVNEDILAELKARLKKVKIDGIFDAHYIEELIEDAPNSLVQTLNNTEKPDVFAAKILEGRIGIICDGSPDCLILPKIFIECLMSAEDYYIKPVYATYLRFIRLISFLISISLAGIYVAFGSFHQEMIPTKLLITMAGQREGVPLPQFLEAIFMILFFEFLKESGLRLPKSIGSAVTLVGGLVIGQAAVDAGIISAAMVIIVSATGITEFVNPPLRDLIVIYRLIILILGGFLGLFGIACGMVILMFHLMSIKSFGVPYLYPMAPYDKEGMKDFVRRSPIKYFKYRPKYIADENSRKRK